MLLVASAKTRGTGRASVPSRDARSATNCATRAITSGSPNSAWETSSRATRGVALTNDSHPEMSPVCADAT